MQKLIKCSSCGGMMHYSPKDEALKCLYCGNISPIEIISTPIKENDFHHWREKLAQEDLSELTETSEIKCHQCGAMTTLPPDNVGGECAFCSTPLMMKNVEVKRLWKPEYLLPFKIEKKQCSEIFAQWIKGKWFIPNELKNSVHSPETQKIKGIYIPFWTFDADTFTTYIGKKGLHRTETYRDSEGKNQTRIVTDWYRKTGSVAVSFDDIIIPASNTLPNILRSFTNWDTKNAVAYREAFLAGFVVEIYQKEMLAASDEAKAEMQSQIKTYIYRDIGGDEQEILSQNTAIQQMHFKLMLLPVWVSGFHYNGKFYHFIINGRTGQVRGEYPLSYWKIAGVILLVIFVLYFIFSMNS